MAIYAGTTEGSEALAAATEETLVQVVSATTVKPRIVAWGVSFDGTTSDDTPVRVRLARQTTAGTRSTGAEVAFDLDAPTAATSCFHSFTAAPTLGDVLEDVYVHPQGGIYIKEYIPGREPVLDNLTTSRIGITVNAPAIVNAVAWIHWEE